MTDTLPIAAQPHKECVMDENSATQTTREADLEAALREVLRLRLATEEGSLRVRADRIWDVARRALEVAGTGKDVGL